MKCAIVNPPVILHMSAAVNTSAAIHWSPPSRLTERMRRRVLDERVAKLYVEKNENICYNKNAFAHAEDKSMLESKLSAVWGFVKADVGAGVCCAPLGVSAFRKPKR